jgi:type II secretory pathway pseudopilin PulG
MRVMKPNRLRGFTMVEALLAMSLMGLLGSGAMALFLSATRLSLKSSAQTSAGLEAANALEYVIEQTREAQSFSLANELPISGGAFIVPGGRAASDFQTTMTSTIGGVTSTENVYTAMELALPPGQAVTVKDTSGIDKAVVDSSNHATPIDRAGTSTTMLLIYRGDPDGTPDPDPTGSTVANAGTYLWQYTMPAGNAFNTTIYPPRALCKSIAVSPNAVQFVRPIVGGSPASFQVQVKIISGYYSAINGTQTNEAADGSQVSQLVGKCALMRNHSTNPATGGTNQTTVNNTLNNAWRRH